MFEKRWQCKKNNHWSLIGGINIRYSPGIESYYNYSFQQDVSGQNVQTFELDLLGGNNNRPWLNYNLGARYSILLSNNNFLSANLLANVSGIKVVNGTYTINVTGKPSSTGSYSANLSCIGLAISYTFTGSNERLLKLYQQELDKKP